MSDKGLLCTGEMSDKGLLCTGAAGSVVAAICCFTPALVLLLAWLAWLDYVLLPALVLFLGITVYALIRIQRAKAEQARSTEAR